MKPNSIQRHPLFFSSLERVNPNQNSEYTSESSQQKLLSLLTLTSLRASISTSYHIAHFPEYNYSAVWDILFPKPPLLCPLFVSHRVRAKRFRRTITVSGFFLLNSQWYFFSMSPFPLFFTSLQIDFHFILPSFTLIENVLHI